MTLVRITCGECGAGVSPGDKSCSRCGANVEFSPPAASGLLQLCPNCGHRNVNPGEYCESCSAKLSVEPDQEKKKSRRSGSHGPRGGKSSRTVAKDLSRIQVPIMGLGLLVGGFLFYNEWTRDFPPSTPESQPAESSKLSAQLHEIEHLQQKVNTNPDDSASLLRLANLLQDLAGHDRQYLPRAVDAYEKYLTLHPESEDPRVDLGICYFDLSKGDGRDSPQLLQMAIHEMETVYNKNPNHQPAAYNLGIVNLSAGNASESNVWFRRAIAINPDSDLGQRARKLLEQHTFEERVN